MKITNVVAVLIAIAGAGAGATGSRMLASAPEIQSLSEFPFVDLAMVIPSLLLIAWGAVAALGKYSTPLFFCVAALGIYGAFYGLFELLFHSYNARPALSSIALLLFGLSILTSCYLAVRLFAKRIRGEA